MYKVPLKNPQPDINNFIRIIKGESISSKGIIVELFIDEEVRRKISTELLGFKWVDWVEPSEDSNAQDKYLKNYIRFWYRMGYDYVRLETSGEFAAGKKRETDDTACLSRG